MNTRTSLLCVLLSCASLSCGPKHGAADRPTAAEADAFARQADDRLRAAWIAESEAAWAMATNITPETEAAATLAAEESMKVVSELTAQAPRYVGASQDPTTERLLALLMRSTSLPAPADEALRKELAELSTRMNNLYATGQVCEGEDCKRLEDLSEILAKSDDYDTQLKAWTGWHDVATPMRPMYQRFAELGNQGAVEMGYADLGALWRSTYDMPPDDFVVEMDRLWGQVKPLYEQLHCAMRAELLQKYGAERVPADGPIPAHLLGNMWAQEWGALYPLVTPHPDEPRLDVTPALEGQGWDALRMVRLAEGFFTSLGLKPLPQTFWERSMFTRPEGKEVVCHASAWDPGMNGDARIKMCIKPTMDDLITIHHELGHDYYYLYYHPLPALFQQGAHDGFHEAIGDTLVLSVTPAYLQQAGLLEQVSESPEAVLNKQMQTALERIAFLPFGFVVDRWRWGVFSGEIPADRYNTAWWELREQYQGVAPAVARGEQYFDPGAKYHIPGNTPYSRYFLSSILQFQFHKALCEASGFQGPLHECSIYGSQAAGEKMAAMLSMGASQPWPDALEVLTGSRQMDAAPMIEYFQPLMAHLQAQNAGRSCGW